MLPILENLLTPPRGFVKSKNFLTIRLRKLIQALYDEGYLSLLGGRASSPLCPALFLAP